MEYEKGDELVFDNDIVYVISDYFRMNDKNYLYLVSKANLRKASIMEEKDGTLLEIESDVEFDQVLKEFVNRNKEEIENCIKEVNEN